MTSIVFVLFVVLVGCSTPQPTTTPDPTPVEQPSKPEAKKDPHHGSPVSETVKIAEGVYSYGSKASDYFSMFVVTEEGVIAFESVNSKHASEMVQAIRKVTDLPIKYLLHSHNHWDHASGGQVFIDLGAKTVAHEKAAEWMAANKGQDMAIPTESWSGNLKEIKLGGTTVELHYLGMNHGLGMTVFVLPKQRVAYIADLVTPHRVMFNVVPDFNIREWERSLTEILELNFDKAVFSHNPGPNSPVGDKSDVAAQLQFIKDLRNAIYAEMGKGTNPMAVPSTLQLPAYKDWAMYDQWLEMNVWRLLMDEFMGPFPWSPAEK